MHRFHCVTVGCNAALNWWPLTNVYSQMITMIFSISQHSNGTRWIHVLNLQGITVLLIVNKRNKVSNGMEKMLSYITTFLRITFICWLNTWRRCGKCFRNYQTQSNFYTLHGNRYQWKSCSVVISMITTNLLNVVCIAWEMLWLPCKPNKVDIPLRWIPCYKKTVLMMQKDVAS